MVEAGTGMLSERARRWLTRLSTATATLPAIVAVVRGLVDGWIATSDNALIAIRGLDVLDPDHHPLVGTLSSVSLSADETVHHPGPLLFDALALPSRLLGSADGVPLVVGVINALCAWWMISLVGRFGGLAARLVAAIVVGLLAWAMAWPVMIDPWNPHAAMVPALLFLVACGALSLGEPRAAMPAVVAGSLCLQLHIGYVYIIGLTLLVTVGLWALQRRAGPPRPARRSTAQRLAPIGVLIMLWLQPLIDLLVNRGDSNVVAMLTNVRSPTGVIGPSLAAQLVAAVVAVPPWWLPNGFDGPTAFDPPPAVATSVLALLAVGTLLAVVAWRGSTPWIRRFGLYVALLLPLAVISISRVPLNELVGFTRHQWRWLWSLGALVTLVLGWAVVALLQRRVRPRAASVATAVAATAGLCVVALNAIGDVRTLPLVQQEQDAVAELVERLPFDELARCGQVVVDYAEGFEPPALVAPSVLLALRERDIEFAPTAPDAVRQLDRRPRGDGVCRLALRAEAGDGRLVGALDAPLELVVTYTPEQ